MSSIRGIPGCGSKDRTNKAPGESDEGRSECTFQHPFGIFGNSQSVKEERPNPTENANYPHNLQELFDSWRTSLDAMKPVCPECGRVCSNNGNLKQHMKNMHGPPDQWETCYVCQKQCKSRQYLLQHLLQTHGIRQRSRFMTNL